jgi:hypothetical protein
MKARNAKARDNLDLAIQGFKAPSDTTHVNGKTNTDAEADRAIRKMNKSIRLLSCIIPVHDGATDPDAQTPQITSFEELQNGVAETDTIIKRLIALDHQKLANAVAPTGVLSRFGKGLELICKQVTRSLKAFLSVAAQGSAVSEHNRKNCLADRM